MQEMITWTWDKVDNLYNAFGIKSRDEICEELGVTPSSLLNEISKMMLKEKGEFTCEEKKIIRDYGESLGAATMFMLEGRTSSECGREASLLYP